MIERRKEAIMKTRDQKNLFHIFAIAVSLIVGALIVVLAAIGIRKFFGNMTLFDTQYTFTYAWVELPDQTVEGVVESWTNFADGDMIQVTIDGRTYLGHSSRITLVTDWDPAG